ncbi:MAG: diguanylate cyclase [Chloroflexota bacterium]
MTDNPYGTFLQKIILDLLARRNLNELLENILAAAGEIVNTSHGFIDLVSEPEGDLRMRVQMGLFQHMVNIPLKPGQGLVGKVWQSGEPLIVDDYDSWEGRIPEREPRLVQAAVGIPLKSGEKVVGVLVLAHQHAAHEKFDEQKVGALKQFAALAALTIDNVRLYESAKNAADRMLILYRATQEISASLEIEQVCAAIQHATEQIMPCEEFVIDLYDPQTNEIISLYAIEKPGKRVHLPSYVADHGLAGHIIHTAESVLLNSEQEINQSGIDFELFGPEPSTVSILAVPLKRKGEVVGMISAQSYTPHSYSTQDQELLEVLAAHAASAIENARLFSHAQLLAATDAVTRLYNRHRFFELAEREFRRAHRYARPLAVLMIDIDHFKVVNDTYGHATGDETLFNIARCIHRELRETDILGRYGGDEFIALLPETGVGHAQVLARRLCKQLERLKVKPSSREGGEITASIGIASLDEADERLADLLEHADRALYAAKEAGRNCERVWPGESC